MQRGSTDQLPTTELTTCTLAPGQRWTSPGGLLGTGSSKKADKLIEEAVAAGMDRQDVAMEILSAAADYKPRRWAR